MPKLNVYLSDDLAEAVREAGVPVSAVCQRALEQAVRRVTAVREITANGHRDAPRGTPAVAFTARAMTILQSAHAEAVADGAPALDSEHVLRAIVADRDSMAVRVLATLDITPRHVQSELDRRAGPGPDRVVAPQGTAQTFDAEMTAAVELAANESSALGTSYIGTEHLLLGLIGEPEGVAGHVLRSLGADLRITRRTVAAALAGWGAHAQRNAVCDQSVSGQADQIAAIVRAELKPVLARLDRLEQAT